MGVELVFERVAEQMRKRAVGHTKYYSDIAVGLWPAIIKDGTSSNSLQHEREVMTAALAAGASEDERKKLVKELESLRPKLFAEWRERIKAAAE